MVKPAGDLARALEELIAALDRRAPQGERAGEAAIVRDAAALRAIAVERLAEPMPSPKGARARRPGRVPRRKIDGRINRRS